MKRYIKIILFIVFVLLIGKVIINIFVNKKEVSYTVFSDKRRYKIVENFKRVDKNNLYSFTIKNNKDIYNFAYNKDFNKESKIINDIKFYKKNNLKCILPVYKDNSISDIYCLLDNEQVSYSYLKQINNKDIDKIIKKIKNKDLDKKHSFSDNLVKYKNISIYEDNITDDLIYTIWYYKGLYVVDKDGASYEKILKKDKYENDLSMLVDKYYIMFNTDKMDKKVYYKELFIYDIENKKLSTLELEEKLSIDTYINGVFDNKLYVTDVDSEKQYSINPKTKKQEIVGSVDNGFYTVNEDKLVTGKLKNNKFSTYAVNSDITKLYKVEEIIKDLESYYFKTAEGDIYKVTNNDYNNPIKLFNFSNIKEWKVNNGYISFIVDNTVYLYSDEVGLRPIILDNELKYNYKNIYDLWKM